MAINVDKTQMMVLVKPNIRKSVGDFNVVTNNVNINCVKSVKLLGLTIPGDLDWSPHIKLVIKIVNLSLNKIKFLQPVLTVQFRKIFI